ncbi:WecB/TagA/CpsF family glycosyltransferase [Flavobacterium sp. GT2N3]|uniref:WecB/TagA/CpsF family glycosyltransferase n=1 Tax=unclassified Flavobacterium TaxID=196869 RepID=UPI003AAF816A
MVNFFAGIPFSTEDIEGISKLSFARIATVNNEYIFNYHTDINFKNTLKDAVFVCDGRIPFLFSKNVLKKYIVNITGIDLIKFVYGSGQFKSVLFIGDTDEANFEIVDYFNKAGFRATGWNPFIGDLGDLKLNEDFFKYDAVFVALGCKKQEKFIDYFKNDMQKNGVQLVAGIGGAYSIFLNKKTLPSFVYNAGLGSIWRLFQEFKLFRIIRLFDSLKAFRYYFK